MDKFFFKKVFLPVVYIQNDQRVMAIILRYVCWGTHRPPPPLGEPDAPTPKVWVNQGGREPPPPPTPKQLHTPRGHTLAGGSPRGRKPTSFIRSWYSFDNPKHRLENLCNLGTWPMRAWLLAAALTAGTKELKHTSGSQSGSHSNLPPALPFGIRPTSVEVLVGVHMGAESTQMRGFA